MAKQVFDSHDLSEVIYAFSDQGREEHQEKHYHVCREIVCKKIVQDTAFEDLIPEFYYWYYEDWMRHEDITPHIVKCLQGTYIPKELRLFSLFMRWCQCCSRHIHYKTVPFKPADPVPESKNMNDCSCPCRHLYRFFKSTNLA